MTVRSDAPDRTASLPRGLRLEIFLRSLSLQASWNNQRMQNLGLLTALLPWLRRQPPDADQNRLFCRRYYEFFNTNPYLANFILGGLLRLEADRRAGRQVPPEMIATYRDSLGRTFASLGDQLFWLGLKPALTMLICLLALAGRTWAILVVVMAFGIGQLALRWVSLDLGYRLGRDIVFVLRRGIWHRSIDLTKKAGKVLTGMVAGAYLAGIAAIPEDRQVEGIWLGVALGFGLPLSLRKRLPGEILLLLALGLALVMNFAI